MAVKKNFLESGVNIEKKNNCKIVTKNNGDKFHKMRGKFKNEKNCDKIQLSF